MGGLEPTPLSCVRGEVYPRQVVSIAGLTETTTQAHIHLVVSSLNLTHIFGVLKQNPHQRKTLPQRKAQPVCRLETRTLFHPLVLKWGVNSECTLKSCVVKYTKKFACVSLEVFTPLTASVFLKVNPKSLENFLKASVMQK